jgi:transposase-like protein
MNDDLNAAICPECNGRRLVRYGRTKAGLQKYRCLDVECHRQFVSGSKHRIDPDRKQIALNMLAENVPLRTVSRIMPDISRRYLSELRRRMKNR